MDERQRTVFTWLHVSDIHAGRGSTSDRWDQGMVLQALVRDAEGAQQRGVPAPDAIFVTGDIAYSGGVLIPPGSDGEYEIARRWLHELAAAVGVTQDRIFLVPGNHDVARATPGKDRALFRLIDRLRNGTERLDDALADPGDRGLLENRLHGYRELASGFAEGCDQLYWAHRFKTAAGQSIRVIGFDTALLANDHLVRARARRAHGHTLVLHDSSSALPANPGVELMRIAEFRDRLLHVPAADRFVIGTLAAEALARAYYIDEVFIPPDAVPARPDDDMEDRFWETRVPALELVDTFLADPARRVLFVLGGYGSGKSALMAHLVRRHATDDGTRAAYIPLRLVATSGITALARTAARQLRALARDPTQRSVVLLDGLDELPNAMDPREKRANMLQILQAARHTDKLIVTARTSYFRGLADFWSLFERDGDAGLWSRLARHIPEGGGRPGVSAIILREFCSAQIEEYVLRVVRARGLAAAAAEQLVAAMDAADSFGTYREMARNPLYLFLLVNTQPWDVPEVGCFADVLALFVRYWLQRDMEKGPSRWLLSMLDREELIAEVAWEMFRTRQQSMTFDVLDRFVTRYFEADAGKLANPGELDAIKLDLQTTGLFTSVGGLLIFTVSAYLDYFVARRFLEGRWSRPAQLPSTAQARLWLGLVETGHAQAIPPTSERGDWDVLVSRVDLTQPIRHPPDGVLCGEALRAANRPGARLEWPVVNGGDPLARVVIQLALYPRRRQHHPDEQRAYLLIANKLGLHARTGTKFVQWVAQWLATFPAHRPAGLVLYKGDRPAEPNSILSVLTLMAPRGSVIEFVYWNCSIGRFEELMRSLHAVRQPDTAGDARWVTHFGEQV